MSRTNCAFQTSCSILFILSLSSSWKPLADRQRQSDWQEDMPSFIPVYSKWKPAAETLMSDWKVKYRLLDVLFSSWGIVVPTLDNRKCSSAHFKTPVYVMYVQNTSKTFFLHIITTITRRDGQYCTILPSFIIVLLKFSLTDFFFRT